MWYMGTKTEEQDERDYSIRAVDRTCDLLDTLAAAGRAVSLTDLAAACRLPKTSVFRYMATLEARRYVEKVGDTGDYRLGIAMASFQVDHFDRLSRLARPTLERLRNEFGETTNLGLLVGSEIAYLDIVESPHSVRLAARKWDRDAVHCTALGKAIVASLPDAAVCDLIGLRYQRRTDNTITGWIEFQREMVIVRNQGFAVDDEENEVGGRCVAVRIPGDLHVGMSLSAVAARLPREAAANVARRLKEAAEEIAARI